VKPFNLLADALFYLRLGRLRLLLRLVPHLPAPVMVALCKLMRVRLTND
jgi:hypothetical protein